MAKIPQRLGEYRLMRHVRSEAGTEIYRAVNVTTQDKRVLKVLTPTRKTISNRERVQQLRHELHVAGQLKHRTVLRVHEFCEHKPYAFLALEPFLGQPLRQLLLEKKRDAVLEHLPQLAEQMSAALCYLHQHGWTHCNVKPSSFLINPRFELKLTDFSLAKRLKRNKLQFWTGKHCPVGSPSYMAPEQIRGQALDERSDIYSLGCTLFELLEGRVPYSGASQQELISKHLSAKTPRITVRSKHITPQLVELVEAMMAKTPENRPGSMLHVRQSFHRLFSETNLPTPRDFPVTNAPDSSFELPPASPPKPLIMPSVSSDSQHRSTTTKPSSSPKPVAKKTPVVRSVHWRWLPVSVVIAVLAILVGTWWVPENDEIERQILERFEHLASAMEQPPEFASQATRQQYWQELDRDVQAGVASAQQQLAVGTASRPDRLELNWATNLLPRVLDANTAVPAKPPLLAIFQEHLHNAREHLNRRDEKRSARSQEISQGVGTPVVFWLVVVVDVVVAAMALRLYLRVARSKRSKCG